MIISQVYPNYSEALLYREFLRMDITKNKFFTSFYGKRYLITMGRLKKNPHYREAVFWKAKACQDRRKAGKYALNNVRDVCRKWEWQWYREEIAKMKKGGKRLVNI